MKIELTLSIGYSGAEHEDIVEIDDEEWNEMNEIQQEKYLNDLWQDWSSNYIDGGARIVE